MNLDRIGAQQYEVEYSTQADGANQTEYDFGQKLFNNNGKRKKFKGLAADIDGSNLYEESEEP